MMQASRCHRHAGRRLLLAFAFVGVSALPALAQSGEVADFYKGKNLTIVVGSEAGSGYDLTARLLGRHIGRHIPGQPTIIVQNMPGGGGRTAAMFINNVAPKDGSTFAAVQSFIAVDPLFDSSKAKAEFDPRTFTWLGSISSTASVAVAWHTAPVKNYKDLFEHELVVGGVGAGTPMVTFPYLFSRLLGMKFKVVAGYPSSPQVDLAMERGEVQGRVDYSWNSLRLSRNGWLKEGKVNMLFQMGLQKHRELADVPLILDLARTDEERKILRATFFSYEFGRVFVAPPNLPAERTQALRKAFMDTMKDPGFLKDAEQQNVEVNPVAAERLESLIQEVYSLPPSLLQRAKMLQDPSGPSLQ
jgi:tripartite-type tricarboxylate transporter receptor subunit TctC